MASLSLNNLAVPVGTPPMEAKLVGELPGADEDCVVIGTHYEMQTRKPITVSPALAKQVQAGRFLRFFYYDGGEMPGTPVAMFSDRSAKKLLNYSGYVP